MSRLSDIADIATCHRLCFSNSLSSKLGMGYTKKTLEWFLAGDNRFLFHVLEKNKVVGYCGGFCPQYSGDGSTSGMMQYAMKEAVTGTLKRPGLFFHKEVIALYPIIFKNIFTRIFAAKKKPAAIQNKTAIEKRTGLVVIGVHPDYRGKGIFELLMQQFEKESIDRNINKMILSVKKENTRAVHAYKKIGWQIGKENSLTFEMIKLT